MPEYMQSEKTSLVCLALWLLLLSPAPAGASWQGPSGTLTGVVQDPTGAVVPGVEVNLTDFGTNRLRSLVTDGVGRWTANALQVGAYNVSFLLPGFQTLTMEGVEVEAAVVKTVDAVLQVGGGGTEITVVENARLIQANSAANSRQISALELLQVPTSTRSFTHLLSADAGISADLSPVLGNDSGNISPSVNGTRTTSTSLQFNGIDATNLTSNEGSLNDNISPAPETLQEVKLQTSLYDASTGRSGGGNFQLVTRSGTNQYHGSAYWYVQNERFNANDFFFNKDRIEKPRARRNEGGFTIGGPIVGNRTFFFGGYQRTQASTAFVPTGSSITTLPTALGLIDGARTPANLAAAFNTLNPGLGLADTDVSPIAVNLLNVINPVTGDYIIPAPASNATPAGADQTGNPLSRQRNVQAADFMQDQFTLKLDHDFSDLNRLSGTFFFSDFPSLDPFPDPSSLASPFTLRRADEARTLSVSDIHTFSSTLINEVRGGFFFLDNTRRLDDAFLPITGAGVGIPNPALFYDDSPGTARLGHFVFQNELSQLSFGGPNDSFNKRDQKSFSFADNMSWVRGAHNVKLGGEWKYHRFATSLPEEQATEFEKFNDFTQFLMGLGTEADTQFGITAKNFRMQDLSFYLADDWRVTPELTLNMGLRWDWYGWPWEENGLIGNFDFDLMGDTEDPFDGFIVPSNVEMTGFPAIDSAIATSSVVDSKHTLNGQDLDNFAPRFGFAYRPLGDRFVVRGGYGIFYDRPSAAFINTVFSNYPFLREVEVTYPSGAVPLDTAFSQQDPTLGFNQYLPFRLVYGSNNRYSIRDNTPVTAGADGTPNPIDLVTGLPVTGNTAETLEFRAIDRDLRTPYVQQWNLGFQFDLGNDFMFEARYAGTKGTKLLQAIAFNQSYDLNDTATPDHIFGRLNDVYEAAYDAEALRTGDPNVLRGALNSGSATERDRGVGVAFGFPNPSTGNPIDYNLSDAAAPGDRDVIPFEGRGPIMGFNIPEAVILQSSANSIYHGLLLNMTKRMSSGMQFNLSYTWSKSLDNNSADPGSTAGGGKPDVPNTGFVVQGDQRNVFSNRGPSDFDRTHRMSASFVYELPTMGSNSMLVTGWQIAGFVQAQSGVPFSIFSSEPEVRSPSEYLSTTRGAGGLHRAGFGRPSLSGTLDELRTPGPDVTEEYFDASVLASATGGFGNLSRNALRGPSQSRVDLSLAKRTNVSEGVDLEFRWDVFNVLNRANFALPGHDLQDSNLGVIENTIGGPRVMQFGAKLAF